MPRLSQQRHGSQASQRVMYERVRVKRKLRAPDSAPGSPIGRIIFSLFAVSLVFVVSSAVVGLLMLESTYSGRIFSNVSIQGSRLDLMRPEEAKATLRERYAAFLATPLELQFESRVWRPTPSEIGVSLLVDEAVDRAYGIGRGIDMVSSLVESAQIWQDGIDLPLRVRVDQAKLQAYLTTIAAELEQSPRNAHVAVVGGQVAHTTALAGRQVLVDATLQDFLASVHLLQPQTVIIRTQLLRPLVEDDGVAETQQQLLALLREPVTVATGGREWTWDMPQLGQLVRLEHVPRADGPGQRITATLDRGMLESWVAPLSKEINSFPVEPRLRFTAAGPEIATAGRDGARLEVEQAVDQLMTALWQEPRTFALPVTVLQPQARPETLANLGIVELVAQGKSSFEESASYRVQNIQAGARQMDGVLIPPGVEFSFNKTVGNIDESNGFTQGYAIIDGRTQLEWGGGVCQVSTTVFRAAFWAGLPITERNQHSFRIRWYEVFEPIGMDAAIFTGPGGYDFRFVNDTDSWLLMETVVDTANEVLTVNLYGTSMNREVIQLPAQITNEIAAPRQPRYVDDPTLPRGTVKQTDTARGGMDVTVGRIVRQNGAVLVQDNFFSRFEPWPNIFVRGTGS